MKLIQRLGVILGAVIGGALGIIFMALINSIFAIQLTYGQVISFGLLLGIVSGVFSGLVVVHYIIVKGKNYILQKIHYLFNKIRFTESI